MELMIVHEPGSVTAIYRCPRCGKRIEFEKVSITKRGDAIEISRVVRS